MHGTTWFVSALVVLSTSAALAAQLPATGGTPTSDRKLNAAPASKPLSGTRPNVFATIQGNALDARNAPLPNIAMRLRDARFGRIVSTQLSDESGLFAFRTVDPGSYIVEILDQDGLLVLAASQILNVDAGEVVSAVVKLPFRIAPGALGGSAAVVTRAIEAGVLAATATEPISPAR